MHDYRSYPRSTTLCPGTSLFSKQEYACITFEYVSGPVIHNKYMSMKNIYWLNDGEAPQHTYDMFTEQRGGGSQKTVICLNKKRSFSTILVKEALCTSCTFVLIAQCYGYAVPPLLMVWNLKIV